MTIEVGQNFEATGYQAKRPYRASEALVFGAVERGGRHQTVVTLHPIKGVEMQAGSLVDVASVDRLLASLRVGRERSSVRLLGPEVLCAESGIAAWIVPGAVRRMWFRLTPGEAKSLNVCWPDLIVASGGRGTGVACWKGRAARGVDVDLYHAPLMNIHEDGRICLPVGVAIPGGLEGREAAEAALFETAFTHVNHLHVLKMEGDRKATTNAVMRFWRRQGQKKVSAKALCPMNKRLSQWLEALA